MSGGNEILQKIDLIFEKDGRSRFFSHHDLMRFFERAIMRTGLPVRFTQGFNPRPRMVFVSPLSLGIASKCEHLEIEFCRHIPKEDVVSKVSAFMLDGMKIVGAEELPLRRKGRVEKAFTLKFSGFSQDITKHDGIKNAIEILRSDSEMVIQRTSKGKVREINISPSITSATLSGNDIVVEITVIPSETARADELIKIFAEASCSLPENISVTKVSSTQE
jgi:radical SAM-linked protein